MIEVDGGQHGEAIEADRLRSDAIESAGYLVIRFWNAEVLLNIDTVIDEIDRVIAARPVADK